MGMKRFAPAILAFTLAATALSCSDPGEPEVVTDVAIIGSIRKVTIGQTIQFEGRAATNSGARVDELITWTVSAPSIIGVTAEITTEAGYIVNRATVTGLAPGAADLIATAGGKSSSVRVTVAEPAP